MTTHNANNERIKRRYFTFLKEARRQSEPSIDAVAKALARFEADTGCRDFKSFHFEQAVAFKRRLAEQRAARSGERLSKATIHATLTHLRRFFQWLALQTGYKSRVAYSDAEYFNPSEKDTRIATARREAPTPTVEQILHILAAMPAGTEIELRDRAIVAFILLTGARDGAVASMKLKHVDLMAGCVRQDARDVQTKFSKTFTTTFFPVGEEPRRIVEDWVTFLRTEKLWGNDDPLFPATRVAVNGEQRFAAAGLDRKPWRNATPTQKVFKAACARAALPYYNPHSLRRTLVQLGEALCRSAEEFKAWSQNLGHEGVMTTFRSYGTVGAQRQAEIMRTMDKPRTGRETDIDRLADALAVRLETRISTISESR